MKHQERPPADQYAAFTPPPAPANELTPSHSPTPGHSRGWLMWLMCLPMLILVGALIATGGLGAGGLLYAVGCLAMMGVMMLWMNHANNGDPKH